MKTNFHTHSTWCDGKNSPEEIVLSAIEKGFNAIGFSSHSMLPLNDLTWCLTSSKIVKYRDEIRLLKDKYKGDIKVFLGVEADFIPGKAFPSYEEYAVLQPEYIIGSVHFVESPDSRLIPVDNTPEELFGAISQSFDGSAEKFVKAYYSQVRQMVSLFDFDIVGHVDLVRKFNFKYPYFDENACWYREEIARTAEVIASSGKIVEINTGAISRGWMKDAYPSVPFQKILVEKGVRFVLSSDSHHASTLDAGFDMDFEVSLIEDFLGCIS